MGDVTVVIPFYGENPLRARTLGIVGDYFADNFPDWPVLVVGGASAAEARNSGARQATTDVVWFNDADSICPPVQVRVAARLAGEAPGLVFAFEWYHRLSEDETEKISDYREVWRAPVDWSMLTSGSSGSVAISRACFEEVGGYDEGYKGRGFEDLDFARRCAAKWPIRRVPGEMRHLWHGERRWDDSPEDQPEGEQARNEERYLSV